MTSKQGIGEISTEECLGSAAGAFFVCHVLLVSSSNYQLQVTWTRKWITHLRPSVSHKVNLFPPVTLERSCVTETQTIKTHGWFILGKKKRWLRTESKIETSVQRFVLILRLWRLEEAPISPPPPGEAALIRRRRHLQHLTAVPWLCSFSHFSSSTPVLPSLPLLLPPLCCRLDLVGKWKWKDCKCFKEVRHFLEHYTHKVFQRDG